MNSNVTEIQGDGNVSRVVLKDGSTLDADLVLLGVGITPNVGFLHGLTLSNRGVRTDAFLKTNLNNIYAAGDVARYACCVL